ncbi:hypothetical protein H5410_034845 [Solanum commersonii]|uniref:Uncharacterized protein n=1 Tax=Solanum commersonii TaxID=4109 RepID=A0A9J5Y095_SOLCO|nr:hypothetical protein H5410_034845 [Solanum commersonii]
MAHLHSQTTLGANFIDAASLSPRPKQPIYKPKRPIYKVNDPRSRLTPYFADFRVLESTVFYGYPKFRRQLYMDLRLDLSYAASWSPRLKRPIYKVKHASEQLWIEMVTTAKSAQLQGQTSPGADLINGASLSPRPKRPIYKVKHTPKKATRFYGDPEFRCHFCQKFTWTSVKTLAMETNLTSFLPKFLKTFVNTLAMEPVGHHGQNDPFRRSNEPRSREPNGHFGQNGPFTRSNDPRSSWSPRLKRHIYKVKRAQEQTLNMEPIGSPQPKRPIYKVKQSPEQNSDVICQKFKWTSIKTLAMEPVGHHSQNVPFTRSNDPRNLSYSASWSTWLKRPIYKVKRSSKKTLANEPVGHHGQKGPFTKSNVPRISWSPWPKHPIYKVKRAPKKSTRFYGDLEFRRHFCQNFTWTSVKTLAIDPVRHHGKNDPFIVLSYPRSSPRDCMVTQNLDVIFAKNLHGSSWSPLKKRPIYKVKRALKQCTGLYSELKFQRHFCQKFTWIQLVTTDKTTYLQGQMIPGADLRYGSSRSPRQKRPINKVQRAPNHLVTTANMTHLQGQTSPEADLSYGARWSPRPKRPIYKVKRSPKQTLVMELVGHHDQNGPFTSSNDPRSNQLVTTAKTSYLQSQTIPEVDLSYGTSWSPQPKQPIYKVKRSLEQLVTTSKTTQLQGQMNPGEDFSYGASLSPRPKRPIYKVEQFSKQSTRFYGDPAFLCHFCQKFTWTSVKTLAMEQVGHHVQNDIFTRSDNP